MGAAQWAIVFFLLYGFAPSFKLSWKKRTRDREVSWEAEVFPEECYLALAFVFLTLELT